jgi:hypothetical protein
MSNLIDDLELAIPKEEALRIIKIIKGEPSDSVNNNAKVEPAIGKTCAGSH